MKTRERIRNANRARQSFVTRRAEVKLGALADFFKLAAGERWVRTDRKVLQREIHLQGFQNLKSLRLVYNWENRFMAVSYNLQLLSTIPTDEARFENTGDCRFTLKCTQRGLKGKRTYTWQCSDWQLDEAKLNAYQERLTNPLITERLDALDIMEMELRYDEGQEAWILSCESLIGSATWILIPPVVSMITPQQGECIKFMELFELVADAVANNR